MRNKEWVERNVDWIEAILNGLPITVSDDNEEWVGPFTPCGFFNAVESPFIVNCDGIAVSYKYWKPATKKVLKAKGPLEIMKALVAEGFVVDDHGDWLGDFAKGHKYNFHATMWQNCGKPIYESRYGWDPKWTEEVEK